MRYLLFFFFLAFAFTAKAQNPASFTYTVDSSYGCAGGALVTFTPADTTGAHTWGIGGLVSNLVSPTISIPDGGIIPVTHFFDSAGTAYTLTQDIIVPQALAVNSTVARQPSCPQSFPGDGEAGVQVTGGTGPYHIHWDGPGAVVTAGIWLFGNSTYTLTVTDANGCQAFDTLTFTSSSTLSATVNTLSSDCGSCNGSLEAIASGGSAPYTYHWGGPFPQTPTITNLCVGIYTLTVADGNGCAIMVLGTVPFQPVGNPQAIVTPALCGNNGIVTVVDSLGNAYAQYNWSTGEVTDSIIVPPGTYTVTVTPVTGCKSVDTIIVTGNDPLSASTNITAPGCGLSDGSIDITVQGGQGPYNYVWSNGSVMEDPSQLAAANYVVQITDANGCQLTDTVSLPNFQGPQVTLAGTTATCNIAQDGSADITITGGTAPFSYLWSDGSTSEDLSGVIPGSYQVTVTDNNGCQAFLAVTIGVYTIPFTYTTTAATCNLSNGRATVSPQGTAPYTYIWSNGQIAETLVNAAGGNYSFTVTDATGCSNSGTVQVPVNTSTCYGLLQGTVYADNNSNCTQDAGEPGIPGMFIDVTPGGGAYTDSTGHYSISLTPGTYTVIQTFQQTNTQFCPSGATAVTIIGNDTIVVNFADTVLSTIDPRIHMTLPFLRAGMLAGFNTALYNTSPLPTDADVELTLDSLVFASAIYSPVPTSINALTRTVRWSYTNIPPFATLHHYVDFAVPAPPVVSAGQVLTFTGNIYPQGPDVNVANNTMAIHPIILTSWDPNDKAVSVDGFNMDGQPLADPSKYLDYHIRFQNTGNDTAFLIVLRDTLDADLDYRTFRLNGTSHEPCEVSFDADNIVVFTFRNILLPDSNVNEPGSHGYVNYSIKPYSTIPLNNVIENQAGIYFDFNPVVMTNKVSTTYFVGIKEQLEKQIKVYPNPTQNRFTIDMGYATYNNIKLMDIYGKQVYFDAGVKTSPTEISVADLPSGIYLLQLQSEGKWLTGRVAVVK